MSRFLNILFFILVACQHNKTLSQYSIKYHAKASRDELINNKETPNSVDHKSNSYNTLLNTQKNINHDHTYNIAVVLRLDSKSMNVSHKVIDAIFAALSDFQDKDRHLNIAINFYDITELKQTNVQSDQRELNKIFADNNQLVIFFGAASELDLIDRFVNGRIPVVTFVKPKELKKLHNVIVSSISPEVKIVTILEYMKYHSRSNLAVLLPATKTGYDLHKTLNNIIHKSYPNIYLVTTEFYTPNAVMDSIHKISRNYEILYKIDNNGNRVFRNIKQIKTSSQSKVSDALMTDTVGHIDAIFISNDNFDTLINILSGFEKVKLIDKQIEFFSDSIPFEENFKNLNQAQYINFVGYNYDYLPFFNQSWFLKFQYKPNFLSYLVHDTLSSIFYVLNVENGIFHKDLYAEKGFKGILDEFQFTSSNVIKRKIGVFRLVDETFQNIFRLNFFY